VTTKRLRQWLEPRTIFGMLTVATTPWWQPSGLSAVGAQLPLGGKKNNRGAAVPVQRVTLLSPRIFTAFTILVMSFVSITIIMGQRPTSVLTLAPSRRTKSSPNFHWLSVSTCTCHSHSHAFPCKCWFGFSHR
jgi:hypothetical protein